MLYSSIKIELLFIRFKYPDSEDSRMSSKTLWIGVVIAAIIIIAGAFIYSHNSSSVQSSQNSGSSQGSDSGVSTVTSESSSSAGNITEKVITIDASRFQFNPNSITVNQGDHVKIIVNNMDTTHGIAIPDFNVVGIDSVEFVADKTGTFPFHCPTICGSGHRSMTGTLIVK